MIQVEFPAVTICSPGWSETNLEAGFFSAFIEYFQAIEELPVAISGTDLRAFLQAPQEEMMKRFEV